MALALNNAQGELSELVIGVHALGSNLSIRDYAKRLTISPTSHTYQRHGADAFTYVNSPPDVRDKPRHLAEIHSPPRWLWRSLVSRLVSEGWTVEQARGAAPTMPSRRTCNPAE